MIIEDLRKDIFWGGGKGGEEGGGEGGKERILQVIVR